MTSGLIELLLQTGNAVLEVLDLFGKSLIIDLCGGYGFVGAILNAIGFLRLQLLVRFGELLFQLPDL